MTCLIADIGGTNARFAIINNGKISDIYRYRCIDFKSAYHAIQSFLLTCNVKPEFAVVAIAGVVISGMGKWTNLSWSLSEKELKKRFGFKKVVIVNDLIPQGMGILSLSCREVRPLNRVKPQKNAVKVLMCMGTGLGSCIIADSKMYPSEYGQTLLPNGQILEKVISGSKSEKNVKKVSNEYMQEDHLGCGQSKINSNLYMALGQAAQNLMLITQPFGGIYLAGAMLSETELKKMKIVHMIQKHPTMSNLLKSIPIFYVANKDLAFVGLRVLAQKYGLT